MMLNSITGYDSSVAQYLLSNSYNKMFNDK